MYTEPKMDLEKYCQQWGGEGERCLAQNCHYQLVFQSFVTVWIFWPQMIEARICPSLDNTDCAFSSNVGDQHTDMTLESFLSMLTTDMDGSSSIKMIDTCLHSEDKHSLLQTCVLLSRGSFSIFLFVSLIILFRAFDLEKIWTHTTRNGNEIKFKIKVSCSKHM